MKGNKSYGLTLVFVLLALSFGIYFYSAHSKNHFQEIAEKQLELVKDNQLTEAYYAYTSKEFQAATSLEDFKKFIKSFPILKEAYTQKWEPLKDGKDIETLKGVLKDSEGNIVNTYFQFISQDNHWKILNMKFITGLDVENQEETLVLKEIMKPVDEQLELLDANSIDNAYNASSEELKKTTSLHAFEEFLKHFPIFTSFNEYEYLESNVNEKEALLKIKLKNADLKTIVNYSLIKEKGQWKVRSISIESQENLPSSIPDFDEEELRKPIKSQLKALKEGLIEKAYKNYTSEAFQKSTTLEEFKKFVDTYKSFKDSQGHSFLKLGFNNNIGTYIIALNSENGKEEQIEYSLIKENGVWKILQIQLLENQ